MASKAVTTTPGGRALGLMAPPAPRAPKRKKEIVLEEDDWTAKMEAIVERDFFPELGQLQDKVQWLEVSAAAAHPPCAPPPPPPPPGAPPARVSKCEQSLNPAAPAS
jgi:hypothetical protein